MAPLKVRRILSPLRGMNAHAAMDALRAMPQAATEPVYKVIRSAVANADEMGLDIESLYIVQLTADEGPGRMPGKGWRARWAVAGAIGRSANVHRTSRSFLKNGFQSSLRRRLFWDAKFIPTVFV